MPPRCVTSGCSRMGTWFCDQCAERIQRPGPASCTTCLDLSLSPGSSRCARCKTSASAFDHVYAAGLHEPPLRDVVLALKYRRVRPAADVLAALISIVVPTLRDDILVIPVPSHVRRVRARGIDPAFLIAKRFAERRGARLAEDALRRFRDTPPQVVRDHDARRENVRNAFRAGDIVRGQHVLLVDDVLTTGATSSECAKALIARGAMGVTVAVAARATATASHGPVGRGGL